MSELYRRSRSSSFSRAVDRRLVVASMFLMLFAGGTPILSFAQSSKIGTYLNEIRELAQQALEASRKAETAPDLPQLKMHADAVFRTVWGLPSGLADPRARGAEQVHGWKTRWQVTPADFDTAFAARYESGPPEVTDPSQLGIVGRGRHVRLLIENHLEDGSASESVRTHGEHIITSLNNVIGWMKMDDGVTKAERQPRVDLTREWDAPIEFWMSTADTGWLFEAYAQALNILKTDYGTDLDLAREHAAAMTALLEKALKGVDVDGNGSVEPVQMEGGLETALQHAGYAGFIQE